MKLININEKLKDTPVGAKLYSPLFGECTLYKLDNNLIIVKSLKTNYTYCFDAYGKYAKEELNGECMLFPSKENRNWENYKYDTIPLLTPMMCSCDEHDGNWNLRYYAGNKTVYSDGNKDGDRFRGMIMIPVTKFNFDNPDSAENFKNNIV